MIEFLIAQAQWAHWYALGLLLLAGLNVPISEDLVVIGSGALAAAAAPENIYLLAGFAYLGVYLSDLESYWLARLVGPRLLRFKLIAKMANPKRMETAKRFLDKYGPVGLLFIRFIPFGVRNGTFMTAGFSRMDFRKFALFDGIAAVMTTALLFTLGYSFGLQYELLLDRLARWKFYIFLAFLTAILGALITYWRKRRNHERTFNQ